jgi:hypothetical protein
MANRTKRTPEKRAKFLRTLAETGSITKAHEAACIGRSLVYEWRDQDETFAIDMAAALEVYKEALEAEADRRAVNGIDRPVFYQGVQVATVRDYSDTLLMFRLKKLDPNYRDRVSAELSAPGGAPLAFTVSLVTPKDPKA